jgi:hypothetical protein
MQFVIEEVCPEYQICLQSAERNQGFAGTFRLREAQFRFALLTDSLRTDPPKYLSTFTGVHGFTTRCSDLRSKAMLICPSYMEYLILLKILFFPV